MHRRALASPCSLVGLALALPLLAAPWLLEFTRDCALGEGPARVDSSAEPDGEREDELRGLWTRYEGRAEGQPLRFWYFHGDGKGLYRYGKVGLAYTHSFDYAVEARELQLRFRKPGDQHETPFSIQRDAQGQLWLSLDEDPREPGARYRKVDSELDWAEAWSARPEPEAGSRAELGDRIWIDYRAYATGGAGFLMYQLADTAIDGRGVGWFHRGDFDEWSTESLTYRIDGDRLELFFDLREEPNTTRFRVVEGDKGRELVLEADPRDYWATHRYRDGGRSFGSAAFELIVGLEPTLRLNQDPSPGPSQ